MIFSAAEPCCLSDLCGRVCWVGYANQASAPRASLYLCAAAQVNPGLEWLSVVQLKQPAHWWCLQVGVVRELLITLPYGSVTRVWTLTPLQNGVHALRK